MNELSKNIHSSLGEKWIKIKKADEVRQKAKHAKE